MSKRRLWLMEIISDSFLYKDSIAGDGLRAVYGLGGEGGKSAESQ
jgi:hypothetical protein